MRKTFTVGGIAVTVEAEDDSSFLSLLREPLGRKSVVRGCANGECGACRVMVNERLVAACGLALRDVPEGAIVRAREDVEGEPAVRRTVGAFEAERPTRCRLCVGGLAVTAHHLTQLEAGRAPEERRDDKQRSQDIEDALVHATCMCTGRGSLRRALHASLLRRS